VSFLRPAIFYPSCVALGVLIGFSIIGLGLVPHADPAPVTSPTSRNLERTNTLNSLAAALRQYETDHKQLPMRLPSSLTEICITGGDICTTRSLVDLSYLANGKYLTAIPTDPVGGHVEYGTGYLIAESADGTLYLKAVRAEDGKTIQLIK